MFPGYAGPRNGLEFLGYAAVCVILGGVFAITMRYGEAIEAQLRAAIDHLLNYLF